MNNSDRSERDKFLKHLKQRPPVERPLDYGRQGPRLVQEITDSMRSDYQDSSGVERIVLDITKVDQPDA